VASWIATQSMMVVAMVMFLIGLSVAYLLRRGTKDPEGSHAR